MTSWFLKVNSNHTWWLPDHLLGCSDILVVSSFWWFCGQHLDKKMKYQIAAFSNLQIGLPGCETASTRCSSVFVSLPGSFEPGFSGGLLMVCLSPRRCNASLGLKLVNLLQPEPKGPRAETLGGGTVCRVLLPCRTADPLLNFDPQPQQRSVTRGELLNTKWSLVEESERRREMHRSGGRERESRTQRTHLSSLRFFFPSFAFSFVFPAPETIGLSSNTSLCPPCPHLLSLEWRRATISGHHPHGRYGCMAAGNSRILGGKTRDEALMRARPRHPGRNACKWYASSKRSLGGRRPSSCWAQRRMSSSGQKNDNQTSPPFFSLSVCFFYFVPSEQKKKKET